jgi:hypothetical protein
MRNRESSSGRGRGRGRYNNSGGRGRSESAGRTYYNNSAPMKTHTTKPKAKLDDAKFDIGPVATRAIEYEKNQRFLLNYIQRTHKGNRSREQQFYWVVSMVLHHNRRPNHAKISISTDYEEVQRNTSLLDGKTLSQNSLSAPPPSQPKTISSTIYLSNN